MPALWDRILQEEDVVDEIRRFNRIQKIQRAETEVKRAGGVKVNNIGEEPSRLEVEQLEAEKKLLTHLEERKASLPRFHVPDSSLNPLFEAKLAVVVRKGLTSLPKNNTWTRILATLPARVWHALIVRYTLPHVHKFLVSDRVPIIFGIESLAKPGYSEPWTNLMNDVAGIYARVLKPYRKLKYLDDDCYLQLGSRSGFNRGINYEINCLEHMRPAVCTTFPGPAI